MKQQDIFIGNTSDNGIYCYQFQKGKLTKKYATKDFGRCTYLTQNNDYLYSVIEVSAIENNNDGYVLAYKKDKNQLINIDKKTSYGQGPCHIEIDNQQKMLFISNYTNGYLTIMQLNNDGTIADKLYCHREDEQISHLHCVKASAKFFFAVDLGKDVVIAYEIKNDSFEEVSRVQLEEGTEPRHLVMNKNILYVITEKSCKIYILKFENKKLSILNVVSILPEGVQRKSNYTGCAIKISKNLKNIYATIRGHNSISVFRTQKETIKMIQNISCGGDLPRDIELDKFQKYILVANQESNDVSIFKRNKFTGKIVYKGKETVELPTCIISQ